MAFAAHIPGEVIQEIWLKDIIVTLCQVYARFLFEDAFLRERKVSPLPLGQTRRLMAESQKKAFHCMTQSGRPRRIITIRPPPIITFRIS